MAENAAPRWKSSHGARSAAAETPAPDTECGAVSRWRGLLAWANLVQSPWCPRWPRARPA
jgi:hypothetical protein